jgi:hypothetical protein
LRDIVGRRHKHPFERVPRWAWWALTVAVLAYSGWFLTSNYRKLVAERVADAKAWRIDGPPCPASDRATLLDGRHKKGLRRFDYEDVTFIRRFGHVSCAPIYEQGGKSDRFYPVCQFTSPDDLLIRTKKGEWYFKPGPGQAATVSTQGGEARCVLASKFSLTPPGR